MALTQPTQRYTKSSYLPHINDYDMEGVKQKRNSTEPKKPKQNKTKNSWDNFEGLQVTANKHMFNEGLTPHLLTQSIDSFLLPSLS